MYRFQTSPKIFGRCLTTFGRSTLQVYMLLPNFFDFSVPNFYDISLLQPESPRSPSIFFFSKGQSVPVSHTSPNFSGNFCLYLTSPNFFGRSHFTFTHLSQLFWDKYVCFLTSPNFFGICQAKVGICHNKLGEVIFFSMTESALKNFLHNYPNFFGISMFVF